MSAINEQLNRLNPEQRAAVTAIDGPVLVLAGAGSGKTRVITHKIAWLLAECQIPPERVAAVTFTNKAAREMKERIAQLIPTERAKRLMVSTFHTLGLRILREDYALLGLKRNFSIFDSEDSRNLIRELLKGDNRDAQDVIDVVQWRISGWKSARVGAEQAVNLAVDNQEMMAARIYAQYERHLLAYNAVDFDDLIVKPVMLFQDEPEARERWQNRFRYLLVDEYQDTNGAQYELLRQLTGPRAAFTVVGDDDQSIYAWRGAQPENLANLQTDFPSLKVVKLEQNFRSTARILRVANKLIACNPHLFEKRLWSRNGEGDNIRVIPCKDGFGEAEQVIARILQHKMETGAGWGDYAILYRGNFQSRPFEKMLREHRIPYHISGGQSFFDRAEVKDLIAYLRLLANPDDDSRLSAHRQCASPGGGRHHPGEAGWLRQGTQHQPVLGLPGVRPAPRAARPHRQPPGGVRGVDGQAGGGSRARGRAGGGGPAAGGGGGLPGLAGGNRPRPQGLRTPPGQHRGAVFGWMGNIAKRADGDISLTGILNHMSLMDMLDRSGDDPGDSVASDDPARGQGAGVQPCLAGGPGRGAAAPPQQPGRGRPGRRAQACSTWASPGPS
jgi:ATP-dependent DNA helicase Rep